MDVLLTAPSKIDLMPSDDLPLTGLAQLLVVNSVSFVVQKLLIHHLRRDNKTAQDLLYLHDTIELFEPSLPELNLLWREKVSPSLTAKDRDVTMARARELFRDVSDAIREATRIPVGRRLDPDEFRLRCEVGLTELLADPKG